MHPDGVPMVPVVDHATEASFRNMLSALFLTPEQREEEEQKE